MKIYLKCIPHQYAKSIYDIDYKALKEQGINTLFFDLDNTIISYKEERLDASSISFLKSLEDAFNILIISNSGKNRVETALKETSFKRLHSGKKPTKFGFKKALKMTASLPLETAVIGDQLMTDVFGANRMGCYTILVKAVSRKTDRWMTKMNRMIESKMLKKIKNKQPAIYMERLKDYVEDQSL